MAMQDRMRHYLKVVGFWHVVILLSVLFGPLLFLMLRPRPPVSAPVEFTFEAPTSRQDEARRDVPKFHLKYPEPVEEDPPDPDGIPEDVVKPKQVKKEKLPDKKPDKPDKKLDKPDKKPDKPDKPKVEISNTLVVRPQPVVTAGRKQLTPEEIRDLLMRGAKPGDTTQIPDRDDIGYGLIRQTLYNAWIQPSREEAGGRDVGAEIRLRRDGTIISFRLIRPSGNAAMDSSVMRALQAVPRISGLSPGFLAGHDVVTIAFKLQDAGA